jgi:ubiquinone/menaquinone biosynthesis C-methylase UbiE
MKNDATAIIDSSQLDFACPEQLTLTEQIIRFYEEAGIDYEHWSKNFNMHFGFYRWGCNPFNLEKMLEQMNSEVAERLGLSTLTSAFLIDMGCGVGATARHIAKDSANSIIKGITISPWQVEKAKEINGKAGLQEQVEILNGDYTNMPFAESVADGVWAIESSCHAEGANKLRVIKEMARVLKKGGRFVVADCFIKKAEKPFNPLMNRCYKAVCRNWFLPEMAALDDFVSALKMNGMSDIVVEDISWRIAPSVAHAPFAVLTFILKKFMAGESLKQRSINNLKGSLLALILGLNRSKFSYCLISGKRS